MVYNIQQPLSFQGSVLPNINNSPTFPPLSYALAVGHIKGQGKTFKLVAWGCPRGYLKDCLDGAAGADLMSFWDLVCCQPLNVVFQEKIAARL